MNVRDTSRLFAFAALLLFFISGKAQQPLQILHSHLRPAVSSGQAALVGPLPAEQRLNLSIVLPLRNQSQLTSLLSRLYDPSSPDYRHFLSVDQFTEQFGPTPEDYQAVVDFAQANGFTVADRPANRMIVPIIGSVENIEKAFNVRMNNYRHPTENRTFYSPDREPSLALSVPVAHIAGLNNFSVPRPMVTKAAQGQAITNASVTGSGPGGSYLASDMRAAYYAGTLPSGSTALTGSGQTVGLVEFDGYDISDVTLTFDGTATSSANGSNYILAYTPAAGGTTYNIPVNNKLLDGATGAACQLIPSNCQDSEQVLDIVQAIGMAPGLSQVRVYIGSSDVDILNAVATENIAQELSISWSWTPDDPYTDDFIFQELAAQGQTVFASSGDYAAYDIAYPYFFPAEDAWITTVGGTSLVTNGAGGSWSSEIAWYDSGGGFSPDGIPIPSWQLGVANASNGGSATLRNVPDVAAEADFDNYDCNMGVCADVYAGTSFAAPRWAGFIALVNQQAMAAGNPRVGFINPTIYAIGQSSNYDSEFHDITIGNNYVSSTGSQPVSYNAVPGYDLVTGWGSPSGQNLINALAPPAAAGFQLSASPASLFINPGASRTTIVTVKDVGGFTGSVNLSVTGLPSGVTASFGTNPSSESSALTLTVSSTAIRGSYLLTISGTSGAVTATTSLALQVNAPGFSIAPMGGGLQEFGYWQIYIGTSAAQSFALTSYAGFTGSVNLAVTSSLPSGVTAYWTGNPAIGSSALTLTVSSSFSPANYNFAVTITGVSGTATADETFIVAIRPPSFALDISPIPWTITQGGSVTATVTVVPVGSFSDSVTLTASQLPSGINATFNPNPATGTSLLTMTASGSAPLEEAWAVVDGNSSNWGALLAFALTVTATPAPTYTIGVSPVSLNVTQGASVTDTVMVTPQNGFTGSVNLSISNGLPYGTTASFGTNPTTGASVLTLNTSSLTPPGFYTFLIVGSSGTQHLSTYLYLTVSPIPIFTLSASPVSLAVDPGGSVTDTITVTPQTGFVGNVTLSALNLPSGVTASFGTNPTSGGTSVLTLTTSCSVPPGNYLVIVDGASGAQIITLPLALTVNSTPCFILDGVSVTVTPGAITANTSTITITPGGGFTGNVALTTAITSSPVDAQYPPTLSFGSTTPVSITGASAGTATLTVSTTAPTTATLSYPAHPGNPWYVTGGVTLACLLLIGIPTRRRGWRAMLGMLALLVVLAGGVIACGGGSGGGGGNPGTTLGTYTITVTGISGTITATNTISLTVQ
jgi:subtilase family serine protease